MNADHNYLLGLDAQGDTINEQIDAGGRDCSVRLPQTFLSYCHASERMPASQRERLEKGELRLREIASTFGASYNNFGIRRHDIQG